MNLEDFFGPLSKAASIGQSHELLGCANRWIGWARRAGVCTGFTISIYSGLVLRFVSLQAAWGFQAARSLVGVGFVWVVSLVVFADTIELAVAEGSAYSSRIARGVIVPFYEEHGGQPYAVLRVGAIYRDYQRRAFFRIGSLPMMVAEGVTIECRQAERVGTALGKVRAHLTHFFKQAPMELHKFRICSPTRDHILLEAGRVQFVASGCEFSEGVILHTKDADLQTDHAWLLDGDKAAGVMIIETAKSQFWRVTSTETTSQPTQTRTP